MAHQPHMMSFVQSDFMSARVQTPELFQRLDELARETAESNWNDEQDEPIDASTWASVKRVCNMARVRGWSAPVVAPCGDGSVHLYWTNGDKRLTVEAKGDEFILSERDSTGTSHTDRVTEALALACVVEFFS